MHFVFTILKYAKVDKEDEEVENSLSKGTKKGAQCLRFQDEVQESKGDAKGLVMLLRSLLAT